MPRDREQEQIKRSSTKVESETSRELRVEVDADNITVTMPGTKFSVTYQRRADPPNLVMTRSWLPLSVTTAMVSKFRVRAFQAAVERARELGWICKASTP